MSYHIYTTKGLVLSRSDMREADRVYSILTRDLGLIRATALGVRKEASKLRGLLEPFSLITASLVKGKEYWRLTSVEMIKPIKPKECAARPLALLEKLVQGESAHPELFDAIEGYLAGENIDSEKFETGLVAQFLFHLGYLKEDDLKLAHKELIKAINDGLQHSQLT